ncbi:hypothetical protein [Colwellia sp. MB02u-14]|uniref:hypothetical protein n=1 Tax=Colwellia sp. MB02u-14 TaxID=2759815 RepID=UPI0015F44918|nr:hypothetical protein [Colwellia sp. MB02u-14]MBA6304199.1 hypothetical protein [Colwellia sp. MB02u-14]
MNFSDLKKVVVVTNNTFIITPDNLGTDIKRLIASYFASQPLVIATASIDSDNGKEIVVSGVSNILNLANLALTATFYLNASGIAQVQLKYKLLGDMPGPNDWKFSNSFKDLPKVADWTQTYSQDGSVLLDQLKLFNAYYVVSSEAKTEAEFNVPLKVGFNFVSKLHPQGPLAIVKSIFGYDDALTVYGNIVLPKSAEVTPALPAMTFPWELKEEIPGIRLQADIGLGFKVGNVSFSKTLLKIYTPTSQEWLDENESHVAWQCYSGEFNIPSADITLDVGIPIDLGANSLMILGAFKGLSLAKMTSLADIAGGGDLTAQLPTEIQKLGSALGKIELTHAGIELSMDSPALALSWASFTLGLPDIDWKVWPDHFAITALSATFSVSNPLDSKKREFSVRVGGTFEIEGIPVNIAAQSSDGFTVYASLAKEETIPLKQLVETYAPVLPTPSDLTINTLRVAVAPKKYYSMALAMADQPNPWTIDLGPKPLIISDVSLNFTKKANTPVTGSFGGTLALADIASLRMSYEVPSNNFEMRAALPETTLNGLINGLSNQSLSLPSGFDLDFKNNYVLIQKAENNYTFLLATTVENFGALAFQIQKNGNEWGFAAGLNLDQGAIASLNGLGVLSVFQDVFSLKKLMLVVSSFDNPQFSFPDMAAFNAPTIRTSSVTIPAQASGLQAGLNFYAQWEINLQNNSQKLLSDLFNLDGLLDITLSVSPNPSENSSLYLGYQGKLANMPVTGQLGGRLKNSNLELYIKLTLDATIQKSVQKFSVVGAFTAGGVYIAGSMIGPKPIDFSVFKLGNLAVMVGCDWAGVPSFGIAGTIYVEQFTSSIAVFFDSTNPKNSMVAGSVSDLHLGDVLSTFTGNILPSSIISVLNGIALEGTNRFNLPIAVETDLDNRDLSAIATAMSAKGYNIPSQMSQVLLAKAQTGDIWYLTDLSDKMKHYAFEVKGNNVEVSLNAQFYCAPQNTSIGDLVFNQGFLINGKIDIFGFYAQAEIEIDTAKGFSANAAMSKIVIGTPSLFSIRAAVGDGGPVVSISTYTREQEKIPEFIPPHFYINGALEVLGLSKSIYANITEKGAYFEVKGSLLPAIYFDLKGHYSAIDNMAIDGTLGIGVDDIDLGPLGTISIGTGVEGTQSIGVMEQSFFAKLAARFKLAGESYSLGSIGLDINTEAFKNLVALIWEKVKEFLINLFKELWRWAKLIGEGIIEGVKDVAKVLEDAFNGVKDFVQSACGHGGREKIVIAVMLHQSQAAALDVQLGPVPPSQEIIEQVTDWAKRIQQEQVHQYIIASIQANKMKAGKIAPTDAYSYVMKYVNSFNMRYSQSQVIDWIERPQSQLPVLKDFDNTYYRKLTKARLFQTLVKVHVDFEQLVSDVTVTLQYPGLQANSYQFTASQMQHIFSADWNETQGDTYTIQYKVNFKDGSHPFSSEAISQSDSDVTIAAPEMGVQSVIFDASSINFGSGKTQIKRVVANVYFSGLKKDAPTKQLTLFADNKTGLASSSYNVSVLNTYSYTLSYYQEGKTDPVYTSELMYSTKPQQLVHNELQFGTVNFVAKGLEAADIRGISLTVGDDSAVFLNAGKPNIEAYYACGPGTKNIVYKGTIITSSDAIAIKETIRPVADTIEIGLDVPWWFSAQIKSSQVDWKKVSMIEVDLNQGSVTDKQKIETVTLLPDMPSASWGFSHMRADKPQYSWGAKYWFRDGTSKTITLQDAIGDSNLLELANIAQA